MNRVFKNVLSQVAVLILSAGVVHAQAPSTCEARFFSGVSYTGISALLTEGLYNFPALVPLIGNDNTRSVQVGPDTRVELYQHFAPGFGGVGLTTVLTESDPNVNRARGVSSALVECIDSDDDGVTDSRDACAETPDDAIVDEAGCSIDQLCSCEGPWKNHGKYVSCVAHTAGDFLDAGLISGEEKGAIVSEAGQSDCGKKNK